MAQAFAGAGGAQQHLVLIPAARAFHQFGNRVRLVAGGLKVGVKFEFSHYFCLRACINGTSILTYLEAGSDKSEVSNILFCLLLSASFFLLAARASSPGALTQIRLL